VLGAFLSSAEQATADLRVGFETRSHVRVCPEIAKGQGEDGERVSDHTQDGLFF